MTFIHKLKLYCLLYKASKKNSWHKPQTSLSDSGTDLLSHCSYYRKCTRYQNISDLLQN